MTDCLVRTAIAEDLSKYIVCARLFHKNSPIKDMVEFDDEWFADFFMSNQTNNDVLLLSAIVNGEIVGIAGAISYRYYFSSTAKATQELYWWVDPMHRGIVGKRMLNVLEAWAKSNGSTHMMMIALEDEHHDTMRKLYKRIGYVPVEHTFMKEL